MAAPERVSARTASLALILLGFALASLLAVRFMVGELNSAAVRRTIAGWTAAGTVESTLQWQQASKQLLAARRMQPRHGAHAQLEGLLQEWRAFTATTPALDAETLLLARRAAVSDYREAARLRPSLAEAWAHLARMKLLAGESDAEFRSALRAALRYGSNDPVAALQLLYVGAAAWQDLAGDPELAELWLAQAVFSLRSNDTQLTGKLDLLEQAGLLPLACRHRDFDEHLPAPVQARCAAMQPQAATD
jgi:hypothetical protein